MRNSCLLRSGRWSVFGTGSGLNRPSAPWSVPSASPSPRVPDADCTLRVPSLVFLCEPPKPESRTAAYRFKSSLKNYMVSKDWLSRRIFIGPTSPAHVWNADQSGGPRNERINCRPGPGGEPGLAPTREQGRDNNTLSRHGAFSLGPSVCPAVRSRLRYEPT